jgi:3-carboxy-cis,cis-muconate cycloisomerase
MLAFERALAQAQAEHGVIPPAAARAIDEVRVTDLPDPDTLGREGRAHAQPAVPFVEALRTAAGEHAHHDATSQDAVDTAAMLVAKEARGLILADLERAATAAERLDGPQVTGRTLLQEARPVPLADVGANWAAGLREAAADLAACVLPVQLGGPVGTLEADSIRARIAGELDLADPGRAWHTTRAPVARLGAALAIAAGAAEKVALDIVLMAGFGELREACGGRSSSMPHKQNPAHAVRARACAPRARAAAQVLLGAMAVELQRGAGTWQAEWLALNDALASTGGAARALAESLERLEVA